MTRSLWLRTIAGVRPEVDEGVVIRPLAFYANCDARHGHGDTRTRNGVFWIARMRTEQKVRSDHDGTGQACVRVSHTTVSISPPPRDSWQDTERGVSLMTPNGEDGHEYKHMTDDRFLSFRD